MLPQTFNSRKGFTLIELMISIAIIGMVFGVVITSAASIQKSSRDTQRQADLKTIQAALQQYHADAGFFPSFTTLPSSITNGSKTYLSTVPTDPTNTGSYTYKYIPLPASPACDNSTTNCIQYCLFATLENGGNAQTCQGQTPGSGTNYNYYVTQP